MFQRLVASRPAPSGGRLESSGALALMAHVLVVAGAVSATLHPHAAAGAAVPVLITWPDAPAPAQPGGAPRTLPEPGDVGPVTVPLPTDLPGVDERLSFDSVSWHAAAGQVPGVPLVGVGDVWEGPQVDEPPALLDGPVPRYPEPLRAAGITGRVVVQAIIDTTGRTEPASIVVAETSNLGFDGPARAFVLAARFRAGRVHGRPVRVLVRLPIEFSLAGMR
jgi:periplasmic protein TonB